MGQKVYGNLILPKTEGEGIQVDTEAPSFGWRDITGYPSLRGNASVDPTWSTYRGNIRQFLMDTTNKALTFAFHIPHDYVSGTDIYLHVHWSHISASVTSGGITWSFESMYSKGHDQAAFGAPVTATVNQSASTTQYQHMIAELQASAASPAASQIDTDDIEVDGLLITRVNWTVNNISAATNPFVHTVDVHYQSTNAATKQKAPPFWT